MFEKHDLVKENLTLTLELLVQLTGWLKANCNEVYLPMPNPKLQPQGQTSLWSLYTAGTTEGIIGGG